jgi:hyperosmotically inducible protein
MESAAVPGLVPEEGYLMLKQAALTGAVALLLSNAVYAQSARTDTQIFGDIVREVVTYQRFTVFDNINGSVDHGVVTLTGEVTQPFKAADIARLVERVRGVVTVRNEIQALPVSFFDDELRYRIARAIYGNQEFWQYAAMHNPPIHIIVDNGRVTLTGVVSTNVERALAGSLANSSDAFSVENRLKTDAEMRALLAKFN